MRYYIVNNEGHILGESESKRECELILGIYTQQEIEAQEIEIIEDEQPVFTVFGVGGDLDGNVILTTTDLGEAIKAATTNESKWPLGTSIITNNGEEVFW